MHFGVHEQLLLVGLLLAVAAMLVTAPLLRIPYPIFLVLGGLALGFMPGIPTLQLPPDVVLIAVLPPLLYASAFFTSLRDLRANARPIGMLAIGLVIATMTVVAMVAHAAIDSMSWSAAFVLGAIVSPTDPIAATAIMRRLGVPRRIVTVVEGEALVNDGTALVLYRVAITAAVSGAFSFWNASWHFIWSVVGGVGIGLVVGFLIAAVRRRLDNPPVEVTIALMTGYLAFIPANAANASGVLAVDLPAHGRSDGWSSNLAQWVRALFVVTARFGLLHRCICRRHARSFGRWRLHLGQARLSAVRS